jgi:hypothetical protein
VSIDDCDTALATKYGSQLGPQWACANTSVQVLENRYADIIHSLPTKHVVMEQNRSEEYLELMLLDSVANVLEDVSSSVPV